MPIVFASSLPSSCETVETDTPYSESCVKAMHEINLIAIKRLEETISILNNLSGQKLRISIDNFSLLGFGP